MYPASAHTQMDGTADEYFQVAYPHHGICKAIS
jgi:hypothetical protein